MLRPETIIYSGIMVSAKMFCGRWRGAFNNFLQTWKICFLFFFADVGEMVFNFFSVPLLLFASCRRGRYDFYFFFRIFSPCFRMRDKCFLIVFADVGEMLLIVFADAFACLSSADVPG